MAGNDVPGPSRVLGQSAACSSAKMAEAAWRARVSVVAIGKYRAYPKYAGSSEALPMDYLRLGHDSGVAIIDVLRRTCPNTAQPRPDQPITH